MKVDEGERSLKGAGYRRQRLLEWLTEHPGATTCEIGSLPIYARYSDAHMHDLALL